MAKLTEDQAVALLPDARKNAPRPEGLVYLMIAPPKWGKTTTFCDVPNALLLAFERGYQFQSCPTIFIDCWEDPKFVPYTDEEGVNHMTMRQAMEVLTATDKFDFIIIDTADMAAKKCSDYFLGKNGWSHPQDGGDFGKGYDIVQNAPFRTMIGAIMGTGRGVAFITHSEVKTAAFAKGAKAKRETSLPGGIHKFLHSQADVIMHGSFGKKTEEGYRERVIQTEGDEETLAGSRCKTVNIPPKFIVEPSRPWLQWCKFFTDPKAADVATKAFSKVEEEEEDDEPETISKDDSATQLSDQRKQPAKVDSADTTKPQTKKKA